VGQATPPSPTGTPPELLLEGGAASPNEPLVLPPVLLPLLELPPLLPVLLLVLPPLPLVPLPKPLPFFVPPHADIVAAFASSPAPTSAAKTNEYRRIGSSLRSRASERPETRQT
jgi:hypothetical protein